MPSSYDGFTLSSSDGNVKLSGKLLDDVAQTGARFRLESTAKSAAKSAASPLIRIKHPSLINIVTSSDGSQTLYSLIDGRPIFSLPPPTSSPSSTEPSPASTTVTLHWPLLTPAQLNAQKLTSPFYSTTFDVILDGPGYPLPRFNLDALDQVNTPLFNSTASPSIQRLLLSPLLSPHRRPSLPVETTIPDLNLGVARTRAASLSKPSPAPSTTSPSHSIHSLIPSSTNTNSLATILSTSTTIHSTTIADEIMILRRSHDKFVRRNKAEFDLLEARAAAATTAISASSNSNGIAPGLMVRGFGRSPANSASRSRERERSKDRDDTEERGRKARDELNAVDEETSRRMMEADKAEEDARGRSRSRLRREEETGIIAATNAASKAVKNGVPTSATINDEDDVEERADGVERSIVPIALDTLNGLASPVFVPHSHVLLSIPEAEELSLPPSGVQSPALIPSIHNSPFMRAKRDVIRRAIVELEEDEAPFEMDEDIDDDFSLTSGPVDHAPLPTSFDPPTSPPLPATTSASFRPGSYRASTLSSSYAGLLATSISNRRAAAAIASITAPLTTTTDFILPSTSISNNDSIGPNSIGLSSSSISRSSTRPTARGEATVNLTSIEPETRAVVERQIRDALALDAPSHRSSLPIKRRSSIVPPVVDEDDDDDDESDIEEENTKGESKFVVGSIPITQNLPKSTPLPKSSASTTSIPLQAAVGSSHINAISMNQTRGSNTLPGSSSLAQSLRNPPPSFASRVAEEEEEGEEDEEEEEEEKEVNAFIPPHLWSKSERPAEEMLSRRMSQSD